MSALTRAEILVQPAVYELTTASGSVYCVDSRLERPPRYLRLPSDAATAMRLDNNWKTLAYLTSLPRHDLLDVPGTSEQQAQPWVLQIGSAIRFAAYDTGLGLPTLYVVTSTPLATIAILDDVPALPISSQPGGHPKEA